jgi:hypothetical protein
MGLDVDRVPVTGTWVRHLPAGGDPLYRPAEPGDFRWQRGAVVEGLYLAADEATVWAEWYRWLAEARRSPRSALPRDLWRFQVRLEQVADLTGTEALARVGLAAPMPTREQWPAHQAVGERLFADGWQGVLYASAARPPGRALCVFRTACEIAGVTPLAPPVRHDDPPLVPTGLRT